MAKPIIYQILPRLWGNNIPPIKGGGLAVNGTGKFSNIDSLTLKYLQSLGVTHIWLTGVIRHATCENTQGCEASNSDWVKGKAGSPYSITDYFDVNPYLANDPLHRMEEFEMLVETCHKYGFKVIIDFVPNHVARDYGQFSPKPIINGKDANGHSVLGALDNTSVHWHSENDFFYYPNQELKLPKEALKNGVQTYKEYPAKASGNDYSPSPGINDWYDTIKLNYCNFHTPTWDKMKEIVEFWASKGVDGFRCDMVELVPAEFFQWLIVNVKTQYPSLLLIAEVYQKNLYGKYIKEVGFDYLYDKSGLYDSLRAIAIKNIHDSGVPVEAWQSTQLITWNWQNLGDLQPKMLNFLENHDEQRFASTFFGKDGANSYAALSVSLLFNKAAFMLYFGEEVAEQGMDQEGYSGLDGRTTIFDWWSPLAIQGLYNHIHGMPNSLNNKELAILQNYTTWLKFASTNPAITLGHTYDLCYCNQNSNGFNKDRHFAFLRSFNADTYLIVANFSANSSTMEIYIPSHAFEWLKIQQTDVLNINTPIKLTISAYNATIIKL